MLSSYLPSHRDSILYVIHYAHNRKNFLFSREILILNKETELKEVTFASGFGRITDMQIGIDGYLYVLSSSDAGARIDRIIPNK